MTGNKFHQNRSRGFRATGVQKRVLPLTWLVALTTVQHYRADCDMATCKSENVYVRVISTVLSKPKNYCDIQGLAPIASLFKRDFVQLCSGVGLRINHLPTILRATLRETVRRQLAIRTRGQKYTGYSVAFRKGVTGVDRPSGPSAEISQAERSCEANRRSIRRC